MLKVVVTLADDHQHNFDVKQSPTIDKLGRLNVSGGPVAAVYDAGQWKYFMMGKAEQEAVTEVAAVE